MRLSTARILSTATAVLSVTAASVLMIGTPSAEAGPVSAAPRSIGTLPPPPVSLWGQLWAWGNNSGYALGDGTTTNRHTPVRVPGMIHVVGAAPGIAVKDDGSVWVWGTDHDGELGNGPTLTATAKTPVQVPGLTGVVSVASYDESRYAVKSDGTLWDWGGDWGSNLGDDQYGWSDTPHEVAGVSNVKQVVAGDGFAYVREGDGSVWGWGENVWSAFAPFGPPLASSGVAIPLNDGVPYAPFPDDVSTLAAGMFNAMAVYGGGKVWTFGYDGYGEAGDGSGFINDNSAGIAQKVTTATKVAAGGYTVYALLSSGTVKAWGDNVEGELGTGSSAQDSDVPLTVRGLTGVTAIAGGYDAGYAVSGGTLHAWGANTNGDLGDGTATTRKAPVAVPGLFDVTLVTAGQGNAFAVASAF